MPTWTPCSGNSGRPTTRRCRATGHLVVPLLLLVSLNLITPSNAAVVLLVGRSGAAVLTSVASAAIIIATGVAFFHVTIIWPALGYFPRRGGSGHIVSFFLLGVAVTTVVPQHRYSAPRRFRHDAPASA